MASSFGIKLGEARDLRLSPRYYQFNRSHAIHDLFDALVELITNPDDSYHRLFVSRRLQQDGGPIAIQYSTAKDAPYIAIRDHAEGMSLREMVEKLGDVGTHHSQQGDRGFMARGAKDCSELGHLTFESIKNDRYSRCEITPQAKFIAREESKAKKQIRQQIGIYQGNGTLVTLRLEPNQRLPRFETIARDLPRHFALRDILAEGSPTAVTLINANRLEQEERLLYQPPVGEIVLDETFEVEPYGVKACLRIQRTAEPFEDGGERDKFRRSGFLIKGARAVHECTLFSQEFERDLLAKKYFGRLECDHIDTLLREYDKRRESGLPSTSENPALLVDPNRQRGLNRDHPFTQALFLVPTERLRALVAAERENQRAQRREIANRETQTRLTKLAKKATEFLKQQLEDVQLTTGDEFDKSAFKKGTLIFPTFLNVGVGEQRALTFYVKSGLLNSTSTKVVQFSASSDALTVLEPTAEVKPHKSKEDLHTCTFHVRGSAVEERIEIRAMLDGLPEALATATVRDKVIEQHVFDQPLEFEYREYRVKEGSKRALQVFAKYPEVVAEPTEVAVESSDPSVTAVRGTCNLIPVAGTNYASGTVTVLGRKLHARATITATVNGRAATADVRVVQSPPETGVDIKIELRDQDYGKFRARWADHEGKPNLLLVSARHDSLSRYLGPGPNFIGQNSPLFRVLLAEIVAESVARKSLILESKERTWEFRWADLKEDPLIADDVFANLQQRIRAFVADAHSIMLSDDELRKESKDMQESAISGTSGRPERKPGEQLPI